MPHGAEISLGGLTALCPEATDALPLGIAQERIAAEPVPDRVRPRAAAIVAALVLWAMPLPAMLLLRSTKPPEPPVIVVDLRFETVAEAPPVAAEAPPAPAVEPAAAAPAPTPTPPPQEAEAAPTPVEPPPEAVPQPDPTPTPT